MDGHKCLLCELLNSVIKTTVVPLVGRDKKSRDKKSRDKKSRDKKSRDKKSRDKKSRDKKSRPESANARRERCAEKSVTQPGEDVNRPMNYFMTIF